jgi:hypothetical protein
MRVANKGNILSHVVLLLLNTGCLQCLKVKDCFSYSTFTKYGESLTRVIFCLRLFYFY